ncbi:MAG: bifunctional 4-hydroxy-2-oxoglutarate aldolase/2-dehydro-3-deoxy-phosphogluconate aldolase [Actinomycetota bacterium]
MNHHSWLTLLKQHRAIAVIRSPQLSLGLLMATAIANGGMPLIEITWNSDRASVLISQLRSALPTCTIGAGTLLTLADLQQAIDCGAQFLFTPHTNLAMIQAAVDRGVPIVPGAFSPTEIVTAWQAGANTVKVFPVSAAGGVNYIKSLQGPLGQIPLIPTGGVTLNNAKLFIEAGAVAVGLAGELFPQRLLAAGDWDAIAQQARTLVQSLTE